MVPNESDEAIRDLSRAREDALRARMVARHQLKALLLRHGQPYTGRVRGLWRTNASSRKLASRIRLNTSPLSNIARRSKEANERLERITRRCAFKRRLQPVVAALMTLRASILSPPSPCL